jgi:hypothetical protein
MKKIVFVPLLVWLITTVSCRKNDPTVETVASTKGTVKPKGKPMGNAITKTIGASGGTLSSADGIVTLTVPADALNRSTVFSIQPIENTLPNGIGSAYRLLPDGITFSKPVTLTFKYNESSLSGSATDLLWTAYQSAEGIWKAQRKTDLNSADKTASITTTHFSDWGLFESMSLKVERTILEPNQSTALEVTGVNLLSTIDNPESDVEEQSNAEKIRNWKLTGGGTLTPLVSKATYKAPAAAPTPNPVTVSVEITNIQTKAGPKAKVILFAYITIADEYLDLNIGGASYRLTQCHSLLINGFPMLIGKGDANISVGWYVGGFSTGIYPIDHTGAKTYVSIGYAGKAYGDSWSDCNTGVHYLESSITISKMGGTNQYIEGSFTGRVGADFANCSYDIQSISGTFRIKRRF